MSRHHRGYGSDEPPRHPLIVPGDCKSASPPKKRQHSKLLTVYQLFSLIPI